MELPRQRDEDGEGQVCPDQKHPGEVGCVGLSGFRVGPHALAGKLGCSCYNLPPPSQVSQFQTGKLVAQGSRKWKLLSWSAC